MLALLLIGLLLWWVLGDDDEVAVEPLAAGPVATAPVLETPMEPSVGVAGPRDDLAAVGPVPADAPEPVAQGPMTLAAVLGNPAAYIGRDDFAAEVAVPEVPTDRGFWVQDQGKQLFAILIDNPRERPIDINPGQRLRVKKGMLRDATFVSKIPGEPLDPDTRKILAQQPVYLVVDEENIEILSRAR